MAITSVNLGTAPAGTDGDTNRVAFGKVNDSLAALFIEKVAGGAGFVNASGAVDLDLSPSTGGRAHHRTMTGNVSALTFSNIPTAAVEQASWGLVWQIDATGGYTTGTWPAVTFVDGRSFDDMNLTANAVNMLIFWQVGATTYGQFIYNGVIDLALPDIMLDFPAAGTIKTVIRTPCTLDFANALVDGAGTVTYTQNGGANLTTATAFASGDVLRVTAEAGQSVTIGVSA